ncbi:hypothetical protein [Methylomonas sp. AM2-LC]|uniref:hypothetical protein n=1 Tax=Methylomonas sp. AM2-LC TaxID=3153301 RepID=UPI003265ACDD
MKFTKTLLAAAVLMATASGVANASLANNSVPATGNEAFLSVYDSSYVNTDGSVGRTFNYDLGVTMAQIQTSGLSAFASSYDLSTDSNWTAFTNGMNAATTSYLVLDGGGNNLLQTGNTNIGYLTQSLAGVVSSVEKQASSIASGEINLSAGGNSSLVTNAPANGTYGQFTNAGGNQYSPVGIYAGLSGVNATYDPTAAYGSQISLYLDTSTNVTSGTGSHKVTVAEYLAGDAAVLGAVSLSGNTLSFIAPTSAVPVPAAVWMFGAGLLGMLRLNRRK